MVAIGARPGVRLINLLAIFINVVLLWRERSGVRLADAARLLGPAAVATPSRAWVVHRTDPAVLSVVAGVLIAASGGRWRRACAPLDRGARRRAIAGVHRAVMNTAGGVGGPAAAMYATNAGWPPAGLRPTLQVYFLGLNIVTVIALGPVRPHHGRGWGPARVALVVGLVAGSRLADRLARGVGQVGHPRPVFAGGLVAIGRGVLG